MVEYTQGNLLKADAEALVNTVNCVGVMGKGIALQFKQAYPEMAKAYADACKREEVQPGRMHVWDSQLLRGPRYIINFPTKRHWRGKSRMEDIDAGLVALVETIRKHQIESVAVPPLGCGFGGLSWGEVKPRIERAFAELPDVRVLVFEPKGAPETDKRVIRTKRPNLTPARALFIAAIDRYAELAYAVTQLEIQKLAYFLQEAGEPLRLRVVKGTYGPYADNLNKVLEQLEGHYIHGFDGNRKPDHEITLAEGAADEARAFLADHPESTRRLQAVGELIEGFETPYGMELLSSVHFVARHDDPAAQTSDEAVERVHGWNERKKKLFTRQHIGVAWKHLGEASWIDPA